MRTMVAAGRRHPQVVDALLAAALAGVLARVATVSGTASGWDWVWFAALHLPLVWRRRRPVIVFWTVTGVAFAAAGVGVLTPSLLVVPIVAGYAVARYRSRRSVWPMAATAVPFTVGWLWHGGPLSDAAALITVLAAAILLGINLQTRRAGLDERARRLEREREQQARLAIADERARIAREMHDIVAHNLAVMVALADGAVAATPLAPQRGIDLMAKTAVTGREALAEIRRLVGLLRDGESPDPSGAPAPQPGFDDIDNLIDQVRAAGLEVTLTRQGAPGAWGPGAGLTIYRIVQEALTNTMKHAGPRAKAEVRLRFHEAGADVEILDDGGRHPAEPMNGQPSGGHGLTGMLERAAFYGGQVDAGPRPGRGWRVHARLTLTGNTVT